MTAPIDAVAGFADPVHDAQRVFRGVLDAIARPGTPVTLEPMFDGLRDLDARIPRPLAAALLALADFETPVWLDAATPTALGALLRFHGGVPIVATPAHAAFAVVTDVGAIDLTAFDAGTPESPERSTTVLIAVPSLDAGPRVVLEGPGLATPRDIAPRGLPAHFWTQRAAWHGEFPCGIDAYLFDATRVIGLPRTTRAHRREV